MRPSRAELVDQLLTAQLARQRDAQQHQVQIDSVYEAATEIRAAVAEQFKQFDRERTELRIRAIQLVLAKPDARPIVVQAEELLKWLTAPEKKKEEKDEL